MSTQKNETNGTAHKGPQANGKHTANTTATLSVVKPGETKEPETPKPSVQGKELPELPPVEDRVLKVQQLFDLTEKREKLQTALKELKSLKASSDNRQLKITIEDGDSEWFTHNTDAVKFCMASLTETLQKKLAEVENLIRF